MPIMARQEVLSRLRSFVLYHIKVAQQLRRRSGGGDAEGAAGAPVVLLRDLLAMSTIGRFADGQWETLMEALAAAPKVFRIEPIDGALGVWAPPDARLDEGATVPEGGGLSWSDIDTSSDEQDEASQPTSAVEEGGLPVDDREYW